MDFKRIELIFLVAFFSLNIFLLNTYRQSRTATVTVNDGNDFANIEHYLVNEKISYPAEFSEEIKEGYYLSANRTNFSATEPQELKGQSNYLEKNKLVGNFYDSEELVFKTEKLASQLGSYLIQDEKMLFGEDYSYVAEAPSLPERIVFSQSFEGILFNDETTDLVFNLTAIGTDKVRVKSYVQAHIDQINTLREKQALISEKEAIITLYQNSKIPPESKIISTQLAYTSIFTVRGKIVYVPVWFIEIETSKNNIQLERVNGFTNSIISSGVSEVKK